MLIEECVKIQLYSERRIAKGMSKKKTKSKKKSKGSGVGLIITLVVLLLLIAGYSTAGYYFSLHFFPGTTFNNTDVSLMTISDAKEEIKKASSDYTLTLLEKDGAKEIIKGSDVGLEASISDDFDKLLNIQNGMSWVMYFFEDKNYILDDGYLTYSYDDEKLEGVLDSLDCVSPETPVKAQNAQLVLIDGEFKIIPEDIGNTAHRDELEDEVRIALETQVDEIDLVEEKLYDQPEILSDNEDLLARKAACDSISGMTITLKFGTNEEVADVETIADWIAVKKQNDGSYDLQLSDEKLEEYVTYLAETYNTFNLPKKFVTNGGSEIEVTNSYYGWLLDNEYAAEELKHIVEEKETVSIDLTDRSEESDKWWIRVAANYDENTYYGGSYAEVSIEQQHMWLYEDGEVILESDVVTGQPDGVHNTPAGVFRLIYKEQNATLEGPGYSTKVSYWMVFADDVGFHDATWQPYFGGQLYTWNGSHGCVNMPLDKAGELYEVITPGIAVFVY